jgi:hypothetical protein
MAGENITSKMEIFTKDNTKRISEMAKGPINGRMAPYTKAILSMMISKANVM